MPVDTLTLSQDERQQLSAVLQSLDPTAPPENRASLRHKVLYVLWIKKLSRRGKKLLFCVGNKAK